MIAAAKAHPDLVTGTGFVYRRQPAVAAIRDLLHAELGEVSHFNGRYWCDYAHSPQTPMAWRYKGGPGTGAWPTSAATSSTSPSSSAAPW